MITDGSKWQKWDLHIHTPFTRLSNNYVQGDDDIWKTYCQKIEESDVSAFGITDYFSIENYFILIEKHSHFYPDSKKVFFPNIELRLEVSVNKKGEEVNIHVIFSNSKTVTREKIEEFLTKLNTNISIEEAPVSCKNLQTEDDFMKACVSHKKLKSVLKEVFGYNKCYLLIAAANNAGLRPDTNSPRKLNITDVIDKMCDGFFGGNQNVEYYLNQERYEGSEVAKRKPVLTGCDAHSFDECSEYLGKKVVKKGKGGEEEVIKNITWIKSELTFEGLKQICHEPLHRVAIGEFKPREALRRIENIKFNFPENTIIKKTGSAISQPFCLVRLRDTITFSPYFTCIIGGRGTGKSTIINILAERLGIKTDFFKSNNNQLLNGTRLLPFDNSVIEVSGTEEIEFISQGKVEQLAEGDELTNLVFNERIREAESEFISLEAALKEQIGHHDALISQLFYLQEEHEILKETGKDLLNNQKIVDSEKDPRYQSITERINNINTKLLQIDSSKNRYELLLTNITSIINETQVTPELNEYEDRISDLVTILKSIEEIKAIEEEVIYQPKLFQDTENEYASLILELALESEALKNFFLEKGTSEESIKDSQKAAENISRLSLEIDSSNQKITNLKAKIDFLDQDASTIIESYQSINVLISKSIETLNNKLNVTSEDVKEIKYTYEFDNKRFKDGLFEEFYRTFNKYHISNTQVDKICEVLFSITPDANLLALSYNEYKSKLEAQLKNYNASTNYVTIITNIFSSKINFLVYQKLVQKHLFNLPKYIKIKGFYGARELNSCSFGQRCTAVIVTLLMTGVKPLVIDEPEAHLDNRLVAHYLVDLIKLKKSDRQIIFATHNSNFVINGDAEWIHILEIPEDGIFTNVSSTTIENLSHRQKLLKLEGGKQAFISRENKYGLKN